MKSNELIYSNEQFEKALDRLREAVQNASDGDELKQDGALQRFEFTFELMWKTLKIYFASLGKKFNSPKEVLRESFREQIIKEESVFLDMLDDRNLSSHTYDFATTRKIFGHLKEKYVPAIAAVLAEIKVRSK